MTLKKFQVNLNGKSPDTLADTLMADFGDCDISWLSDGTALCTVEGKTDQQVETIIANRGLTLKETCRTDIRHRYNKATGKEAAHERLERVPVGQLKKTTVN